MSVSRKPIAVNPHPGAGAEFVKRHPSARAMASAAASWSMTLVSDMPDPG